MDICPSCEHPVESGVVACPSCGARLEGSTASFDAVEESGTSPQAVDLDGSEGPVLVVGKGAEVGERFHLEQPLVTIGRDPESDIFLNDVTVSRRHARVLTEGATITVEDVGSLNGTYVNDELVDSAVLHHGDSLQIGRFRMVFLTGRGA